MEGTCNAFQEERASYTQAHNTSLKNSPMPDIYILNSSKLIQVNQNGKIKKACMYVCWGERGWLCAQGLRTETGRREERSEEFYHKNTIFKNRKTIAYHGA